jgi:hypothetical protein
MSKQIARGKKLKVGAYIKADVWLQGHILNGHALRSRYEGADKSVSVADFSKHLRKLN